MSRSPDSETELEKRLRAEAEKEAAASAEDPRESAAASEDDESAGSEDTEADPLVALQEECEALKNQVLRARAEFENYRKRTERENERFRKVATESLVQDLLPVLDNLELALQHAESNPDAVLEGVKITLRQMHEVLERVGVEKIEALGLPFDPNRHEAVMQAPSKEAPNGHVMEEYQRGYLLAGQVLRPSKVVVSRGAEEESRVE